MIIVVAALRFETREARDKAVELTKDVQLATREEEAGCHDTLLSESGLELVRAASQGKPRWAHQLLVAALRMATDKNLNHLSDDIIQEAIFMLQGH